MRRGISVLLTVILMMIPVACKTDVNRKIHQRYANLKSYTARVRVSVNGNKGTEVYELSQSFCAPDRYRTEVISPKRMEGTVNVIAGGSMWYRSAGTPAIRMEQGFFQEGRDYLFLHDFLEEYFKESAAPLTENEEGLVLLDAPVRSDQTYRFTQNLWIDAKSNLPRTLVTYDEKGNEMLRVEYEDFVVNPALSDSVFEP